MSSPIAHWKKFFRLCNLPSTVCDSYASAFVRERIQPAMLKDLSKSDLRDLGISTLGDQLAILKHIRDSDGLPEELSVEDPNDQPSRSRGRRLAPDRDDIYHVVMPEGKTPRTRAILDRHDELRERGMIKRGTTGVRVSGQSLNRVSDHSRVIRKPLPPPSSSSRYRDEDDFHGPSRLVSELAPFRRRTLPDDSASLRPLNIHGANRFAQATGIVGPERGPPVRRVQRVIYRDEEDNGMQYDEPEPVRVVRRIRYV